MVFLRACSELAFGLSGSTSGVRESTSIVAKKVRGFDDAVPTKGVDDVGIGGNAERDLAPSYSRAEKRGQGAAMLEVTQTPVGEDDEESESGGKLSLQRSVWTLVAGADFFVDKRKQARNNQPRTRATRRMGSTMKTCPRKSSVGEGPKRSNSIGGRVVEQNVAHAGEAGEGEEHSPARRQIRIARFAAPQAPDQVDKGDDRGGD